MNRPQNINLGFGWTLEFYNDTECTSMIHYRKGSIWDSASTEVFHDQGTTSGDHEVQAPDSVWEKFDKMYNDPNSLFNRWDNWENERSDTFHKG